jgi:hypothetical protein
MANYQPEGVSEVSIAYDNLLAHGPYATRSIVMDQNAGASGADADIYAARGTLLAIDPADGKAEPADAAETVVAIDATGEVIQNNLLAADPLDYYVSTALPPIPGTLSIGVTADASATVLDDLGTDDGLGNGRDTGGSFAVNYNNGEVEVHLAAAPTDTEDLKAGYTHRSLPALPTLVLAEDITVGAIKAGDVTTIAFTKGGFHQPSVRGYSAGYQRYLREVGIEINANADLLA